LGRQAFGSNGFNEWAAGIYGKFQKITAFFIRDLCYFGDMSIDLFACGSIFKTEFYERR